MSKSLSLIELSRNLQARVLKLASPELGVVDTERPSNDKDSNESFVYRQSESLFGQLKSMVRIVSTDQIRSIYMTLNQALDQARESGYNREGVSLDKHTERLEASLSTILGQQVKGKREIYRALSNSLKDSWQYGWHARISESSKADREFLRHEQYQEQLEMEQRNREVSERQYRNIEACRVLALKLAAKYKH